MEIVSLGPRLHLVRPAFGQAYLWRDDDGVTLVDTGIPGSEPAFAAAFDELGLRRADLRRIVITHGHEDHMGSAAALREWGDGVTVYAHRADAPIVRGLRRRAEPVLTAAEEPIFASVTAGMPAVPPCPVDVELGDGDTIDFGGGARVIATPGHTDGSIAVALPEHGVLFTGDLVANSDGGLLLGPFNTDRGLARVSFAALSQVPATTVGFGHGDPLTGPEGAAAWRRAGRALRGGPGRGARPARLSPAPTGDAPAAAVAMHRARRAPARRRTVVHPAESPALVRCPSGLRGRPARRAGGIGACAGIIGACPTAGPPPPWSRWRPWPGSPGRRRAGCCRARPRSATTPARRCCGPPTSSATSPTGRPGR